ncbi:MAG: tetratricopeptide repeat protein [Hyphomicrobiales bacterium]
MSDPQAGQPFPTAASARAIPLAGGSVDYFISRRGAGAAMAQEVAEVLTDAGYSVFVQDRDIAPGINFIAAIHEALKRCRHFIALLTKDYDASEFTLMELTNFMAAAARAGGERRLVVLRIEDCTPGGVLAGHVFTDLVGIDDPRERRQRILAAAEGRPALAPRELKIFENVPPRDHNFTGRDKRLAELHRLLADAHHPAAITQAAIHGLGGIGKTSLAAEYAHRYADAYAGVWWAPAEQRTLLVSSLAALAGRIEPRLAQEPDQGKAARAGLARLGRFATPFLLVYDNVETPDTLRDLVPSTGARALVTSRWTDWGGQAAEVKIDVLGSDAAVEFLQKRAGRTDAEGAALLATALGRLPLALDHAGAYCRLTATSFDAYREKIDLRIARAPKGAAYPASIAASFGLAVEKASAEQKEAETLLGFLAFLAPEGIPLDLFSEEIVSEEDRAEALGALRGVSLIEYDALEDGSPVLTLHRLVQAAMRTRVAESGTTAAIVTQLTRRLAEAFPPGAAGDPKLWPRCAVLLPHVLALRELALWDNASPEAAGELLQRAGSYLHGRGAYRAAEPLFCEAVAMGERVLGREHPQVASWLNDLGLLYWTTGRYGEAEPLEREAIATSEKALGREHPDVAVRLNNLARLLNDTGRQAEAEPLFREAIAIGVKTLGREHAKVAAWLNNLGILLNEAGRNHEAEPLYREAIAINEKTLGPDHPEVARCFGNLAVLLRDTDRNAEGEKLARDALEIWQRTLGGEHPVLGRGQENLARILLKLGRRDEALAVAQSALAIHEKSLGGTHKWTKDSARTCADAFAELGCLEQAQALKARFGLTTPAS